MWYFVHRVYYKFTTGGTRSSSIEDFKDGDDKTNYKEAIKRYYSILAADVDNADISYELVMLVDETGAVIFSQRFDNRANG